MKYYMSPKKHGLGWIPDKPDKRDLIFRPEKVVTPLKVPPKTDLRNQCPPVYNQGQLGSCTANALAGAFDFDRNKEGKKFMTPSRLFIYWNERDLEGTVDSDAGASIRDGVKVLVKLGTPPETDWPYNIDKFTLKPPAKAFTDAEKNQALTYQRIMRPSNDPTHDMLVCLASGYPFISGFTIYESFESDQAAKTGIIPMPGPKERTLGGHAIVVVGYNLSKKWFICRNSWGGDWGDHGYFYMPFEYLSDPLLSSDQWLIRTVEV
jgi:C1A family cysteine protease